MIKAETAQLLYIVKANYPRHYTNITEEDFTNIVTAWHLCLSDYDYNMAQAGLKVYLTSDTKGFPPAVGQVIEGIHKIQRDESETLTELDAWGLVYKAICNSNYNSEQEFAKLPDIVQRAVGHPARLREWAQLDTADVMTVSQSNFMRSFRAVQEQRKVYRKMPEDIKQMLPEDKLTKQFEIADTKQEKERDSNAAKLSESDFINTQIRQFREAMRI